MLNKFEDILAQCIDDIKAGRCSVEDCLTKYPSMRKQLEPLLGVAIEIQEPPDVKPSPAFKVRARVQLMEQIHARQAVTKWPWFRYTNQVKPIPYKRRFNMVAIIVAVVLAISAVGGGTAYASQGSLPGDILYPVKLGTEQVRLVLATGDATKAELYLTFANSRVEEMTALAERGRPEEVNIAVNGYDKAMAMAAAKLEEVSSKGLDTAEISELVALATSQHLSVLDEVKGMVPEEAKQAIAQAKEVSINGIGNALRVLATENPERATEINLATIEDSLNRAMDNAEDNDIDGLEIAVEEFVALSGFGEEISAIAQGLGEGTTTVDELVARATSIHLEVLAEVYEKVPEQAQGAIGAIIEQAMSISIEGHDRAVEALEEAGALGDIPEELPIPEGIPERVKEMLLKLGVPANDGVENEKEAEKEAEKAEEEEE